MYKKLFALIIITGLCCSSAVAQEQKGVSLADWLKVIQKKLDKIEPKKIQPLSSSVAGIRRTKEDTSAKLYWMGKKKDELVTEEEMSEFTKGIKLAVKGEWTEAIKELQGFMKQYPDSALIPDAKKTLDLVKAEEK